MQKVELSGEMTSKPTRTQHFARNEAMDDAFSIRAIPRSAVTVADPDVVPALPECPPEVGELVHVRSRRWLVEKVTPPHTPGQTSVVRLACADE